jgi:hypothetical protein
MDWKPMLRRKGFSTLFPAQEKGLWLKRTAGLCYQGIGHGMPCPYKTRASRPCYITHARGVRYTV